jgi:hypothetical protein
MKSIRWQKWIKDYSAGSLPSNVRRGVTKIGEFPVEITATRVQENSTIWDTTIRIGEYDRNFNARLSKRQAAVHYETQRDALTDLVDDAEMQAEILVKKL